MHSCISRRRVLDARTGRRSIAIRRAADRLEAEFLRRLDRFDRAHGAVADGGGSTPSWLRDHCAMTWKAGAYRARLARTLGELPATLDSARAGRASLNNVTLIAELARDVGVEQVAPLEPILVGAAETLELADMRTLIQAARLRIDPDGDSTLTIAPTSVAGSSASRPMAGCSSSAVSSTPKAVPW